MNFTVTRAAQSFVPPSEPTPSESLDLSFIDRMPGLSYKAESMHVFKHGLQPAKVTREAVSKALVPYYPLAGRLTVDGRGELVVECSGEGVWFVEATADCTLEDVEHLEHMPLMMSKDDLLPDLRPGEADLRNVLVMMQVTQFRCGGFVVGFVFEHAVVDGIGGAQFLKAVGDFARGDSTPAISPIWSRHLIPSPPKLHDVPDSLGDLPSLKVCRATFDIPFDFVTEIKSIYLANTGHHCSTFDISVAAVWRSRIRAISVELDPETPVRLCFSASTRHLLTPQIIPREGGYYGNCFSHVTVTASSGDLANATMVDVVSMIRNGKARLPNEFAKLLKGEEAEDDPFDIRSAYNTLYVSDWSNLGFSEVDFGWGRPAKVVPFEHYDCIAAAMIGRPLTPKKGSWVMTQCVKEEHLSAFQEHMLQLTKNFA